MGRSAIRGGIGLIKIDDSRAAFRSWVGLSFWERLLCFHICCVEITTLAGDTVEKERNGRGSDCSLNEGGREGGSGMPVCLARGVCSDSFGPPFVTLCYAALLSDKNDGRPTATADGRMAE